MFSVQLTTFNGVPVLFNFPTQIADVYRTIPTFSPSRAAWVLFVVVGLFAALAGRVAYLETFGRQATIRRADFQQHQTKVLPARRGCVYDRNGILMAGTVQTQ